MRDIGTQGNGSRGGEKQQRQHFFDNAIRGRTASARPKSPADDEAKSPHTARAHIRRHSPTTHRHCCTSCFYRERWCRCDCWCGWEGACWRYVNEYHTRLRHSGAEEDQAARSGHRPARPSAHALVIAEETREANERTPRNTPKVRRDAGRVSPCPPTHSWFQKKPRCQLFVESHPTEIKKESEGRKPHPRHWHTMQCNADMSPPEAHAGRAETSLYSSSTRLTRQTTSCAQRTHIAAQRRKKTCSLGRARTRLQKAKLPTDEQDSAAGAH
ncbi:hypothetical protein C8R46DRAFT_1144088 [Mycena filopes]|nr:hypothetical protein C8R46DRAFT_1144088 [Mycena filopes]